MPVPEKQDPEKKDPEEETDPGAEQSSESDEESEELSLEDLRAMLAETKKNLRSANKEAKERRIRLEELEQEKKKREEEELSEAQKAQKRAEEAEARAKDLEQKNRDLSLRTKFQSKARDLKLSFVNSNAEEDALKAIDPEAVGDDFEGLEDELKRIVKDRPYLFGKQVETETVRDGSSKGKVNKAHLNQEALNKKRGHIKPL